MRESVCIVLNERESTKAKLAADLEGALDRIGITSSRVEIDKNLETIVLQRKARVVVLDYLLGDYSTGLDIQNRLMELPPENSPAVFFLTDEPSVSVAVQAMKNGAVDYIEIDKADAVKMLVEQIKAALVVKEPARAARKRAVSFEDCVASSKSSLALHKTLEQIAKLKTKLSVLYGSQGSGKLTMARATCTARDPALPVFEVDLRTFNGVSTDLPGITVSSSGSLEIASPCSIIISHAEEDSGEILDLFSKFKSDLQSANVWVTVCTNDLRIAGSWQKLTGAELVSLPKLSERAEDIPQLTQHFLREAESLLSKKAKPLEKELLNWLMNQEFSANIRQLRSVILQAAFEDTLTKGTLESLMAQHAEAEASADTTALDPLVAASAVFYANQNLRIAAARLGVRLSVIKSALDSVGRSQ